MIHKLKTIATAGIICLAIHETKAQHHTYAPAWITHDDSTTINGIGVGLNVSQADQVEVNGLCFELTGFGILLPLVPGLPLEADSLNSLERINGEKSLHIRGLAVSPFGMLCNGQVDGLAINGIGSVLTKTNGLSCAWFANFAEAANGVQVASFGNMSSYMNGVQFAFMINSVQFKSSGVQISVENYANHHKGIQLGVFNKASCLKGIQLGIWNKNQKRALPIINWSFS